MVLLLPTRQQIQPFRTVLLLPTRQQIQPFRTVHKTSRSSHFVRSSSYQQGSRSSHFVRWHQVAQKTRFFWLCHAFQILDQILAPIISLVQCREFKFDHLLWQNFNFNRPDLNFSSY
eukprot:g70667.t1